MKVGVKLSGGMKGTDGVQKCPARYAAHTCMKLARSFPGTHMANKLPSRHF